MTEDAYSRVLREWGRFERYRTWIELLRQPCNQPLYDVFGMNGLMGEMILMLWNGALLAAVNLTTNDSRADTSLQLLVDELEGDERGTAMNALETARAAVNETGAKKWRDKYVAHRDRDRATECSPVRIENLTEISAKTHGVLRCIQRFQNEDWAPRLAGPTYPSPRCWCALTYSPGWVVVSPRTSPTRMADTTEAPRRSYGRPSMSGRMTTTGHFSTSRWSVSRPQSWRAGAPLTRPHAVA